jgi:hypothetical protein
MVCEYGSNCLKNVMIASFVTFYNKLGLGFCSLFSFKFLLGCFSKYTHLCNTDVTLPFKPTQVKIKPQVLALKPLVTCNIGVKVNHLSLHLALEWDLKW